MLLGCAGLLMRNQLLRERLLLYTAMTLVGLGFVVSLLCLSQRLQRMERTGWVHAANRVPDTAAQPTQPLPDPQPRIPKILHQTFKSSRIFVEYRVHVQSCLRLNPDWQYYLWRDEDSLEFIRDHFPEFLAKYTSYHAALQRSDSIRYLVLYHFGGVYLDMDVRCVRPFFPALENLTAFLDQEAPEHAALLYGRATSTMNSAMGSAPGHPFFLAMLRAMLAADPRLPPLESTGPTLLHRVHADWLGGWSSPNASDLLQLPPQLTLLPHQVFSPRLDSASHRFNVICRKLMRDRRRTAGSPSEQRKQSLKLQVCAQVMKPGWKVDRTSPETVGQHLFMHLGYHGSSRSRRRHFDIVELKRDVRFYKQHSQNMTID